MVEKYLDIALESLSKRLEDVPVQKNFERIQKTLQHKSVDRLVYNVCPMGLFKGEFPSDSLGLPEYPMPEQINSVEKWLLTRTKQFLRDVDFGSEFRPVFEAMPSVVFFPTMLGCSLFTSEHDITPIKLESEEQIRQVIDKGVPDFTSGVPAKVVEWVEVISDYLDKYPVLKDSFYISAPCCQGSFDNVCQMLGSEIYLLLMDKPELIKELLDLVTETHIQFQRYFESYFQKKQNSGRVVFSGYSLSGNTGSRVVNDSICNISADMFSEFCGDYNERIFEAYGDTGWVHYCGLLSHGADSILKLKGLKGADLPGLSEGYGEKLEEVWDIARQKKIGLELWTDRAQYKDARDMLEFVHQNKIQTGIMIVWGINSMEMVNEYRKRWKTVNAEIFATS